jgi:hypothetical protein
VIRIIVGLIKEPNQNYSDSDESVTVTDEKPAKKSSTFNSLYAACNDTNSLSSSNSSSVNEIFDYIEPYDEIDLFNANFGTFELGAVDEEKQNSARWSLLSKEEFADRK